MKKRLLAALVSGALMMSALAGCGGSTHTTDPAAYTMPTRPHSRITISRSF